MRKAKRTTRTVSLLAVLSLLLVPFVGCGEAAPQETATTTPSTIPSSAATTATTTAPTVSTTATRPSSTPAAKTTAAPTTTAPKQMGASWYKNAAWNEDGVLKILAIGNSFSSDSMQYVFDFALAAGVQDVYLGNMYIGGCSLETHLKNARADSASYTYYTNKYGGWTNTKNYKLSEAVKAEDWDFISFQQASTFSGKAETYDDLVALMDIVAPLCTNPKVELVWHMTWAYSEEYSGNTQLSMYNSIVSAVQQKIVPNTRITKIIPNGTAIQNARTSYIGDNLNRDGSHLSLDRGRFIAGLTTIEALIGIDWNIMDWEYVSTIYPQKVFLRIAEESAKNAVKTPFQITESRY